MRSLLKPVLHHARWVAPIIGLAFLISPFVPLANAVPATLGALALIGMSASLAIAGRGAWLDRFLGGPDKAYVWHRFAGYVAVGALAGHWALASSVGAGLIPPLAGVGEAAGLISGVGIMSLSAIAALRIIPHHLWRASHWLMGPLFAVSVFHTFFSASPLPVFSPPWLVLAVVSAIGLSGWIRTLRGQKESQSGRVTAIKRLSDAVEFEVSSDASFVPFVPGQFQTMTVPQISNEPHPFSISGGEENARRFGVRVSGNWTDDLHRKLQVGDEVILGAPQGCFHPRTDTNQKAQLWVAGGAGITPFLSALASMQPDYTAPITLIYGYRGEDSAIGLAALRAANARLPLLELVLIDSTTAGRMTQTHVQDALNNLPGRVDLYMCGPDGMKATAQAAFRASGKKGVVRHEAFDFRAAWSLHDMVAAVGPVARTTLAPAALIGEWAAQNAKNLIVCTGLFRRFSNRIAP